MVVEKVILGIDPGTAVMGFGIISVKGNKMELIAIHELILKKYENHETKLKVIFDKTLALIDEYHPDETALEAPFFGKNVQSMLKLGRAQGVAMAASLHRNIPIIEYSPKKIKMAITGNGNASKEQVAGMLQNLLKLQSYEVRSYHRRSLDIFSSLVVQTLENMPLSLCPILYILLRFP